MIVCCKIFFLIITYYILSPLFLLLSSKESNKFINQKQVTILPKSFFASLCLVPIIFVWIYFILEINRLDQTFMIMFCCIITPCFYWWLFTKLEQG